MSDSLSRQPQGCQAEHCGYINGQRHELRQEQPESRAFENDAAEGHEKISRRHHVRDDLQGARLPASDE